MAVNRRNKFLNKKSLILLFLLVAILGLGLYKYFQSRQRINAPVIPSQTVEVETNPNQESVNQETESTESSNPKSSSGSSANNSSSGAGPQSPSGSFVSNHEPGNGKPTIEESTCNTTAGAECYIQFTKGGVTKKLKTQTTNSIGIAVWNWDVKEAGLTAGSWEVSAIATLNGKTATTKDPIKLEVGS